MGFRVTVDLVVLTIRPSDQHPRGGLHVLLVRRGVSPYRGSWALPGGFVLDHEDLLEAARRELAEETGLGAAVGDGRHGRHGGHGTVAGHLEQLATYGAPRRDPRGRVVTVAYLALLPDLPAPVPGTDAAAAAWHPVAAPPRLAFDHARILADGVERARAKLEYTSLAAAFCPPEFTIARLREVYEAVWATDLDPRNFHRKVTSTPGFVEPVGQRTGGGRGRPAELYRRGDASTLYPPLLRPA